jgi:hypothetical protein
MRNIRLTDGSMLFQHPSGPTPITIEFWTSDLSIRRQMSQAVARELANQLLAWLDDEEASPCD